MDVLCNDSVMMSDRYGRLVDLIHRPPSQRTRQRGPQPDAQSPSVALFDPVNPFPPLPLPLAFHVDRCGFVVCVDDLRSLFPKHSLYEFSLSPLCRFQRIRTVSRWTR